MASNNVTFLVIGCVATLCFGLPASPGLRSVAEVIKTTTTVPLEGILNAFDCLLSKDMADSFRTTLSGVGDSENPLFAGFLHGLADREYQLGDGLEGNGSVLCGKVWAGELTLLKFRNGTNGTCVLGGDQTFFQNSLLNGHQYFLCDGMLSENYVQFFNGLFKLHWAPTLNESVMEMDLGPLGRGQTILKRDMVKFVFPWGLNISFAFPENTKALNSTPLPISTV